MFVRRARGALAAVGIGLLLVACGGSKRVQTAAPFTQLPAVQPRVPFAQTPRNNPPLIALSDPAQLELVRATLAGPAHITLTAGGEHTCHIDRAGALRCWGHNQ